MSSRKPSFGRAMVKLRFPILILAIVLLIPAMFGYLNTRTNYDILSYLPNNIETMKGQDILLKDFGKGGFSLVIFDGMKDKDVAKVEKKFKKIDHVDSVIWYDSIADLSIPKDMLPDEVYKAFNHKDSTMMAVFFDTGTSADETMDAITQMRKVAGKQCFVSGMSAMVTDLKNLTEQEEPIYVAIAVVLSVIVMMLFMDSYIVPLLFLASIGIAIIWNLGSNIFLGQISYITKALAAILQLAVTMDYSIFLWHSYEEQLRLHNGDRKAAMADAINATIVSVAGSSVTTIAGFIALCFMTFKLGLDLGIVMAKGVLLGVISCVTVLPALILLFHPLIEKTRHRNILPDMHKLAHWIIDHRKVFIVLFIIIWIPAAWGETHTESYYDLGAKLPANLGYTIARHKLENDFDTGSTHMILANRDLSTRKTYAMIDAVEDVKGVKNVLGINSVLGPSVPEDMVPDELRGVLESGKYQLLIVNSKYTTGTDAVNKQVDQINKVMKPYDKTAMLIGEAPATKDLITIADHDFNVVNVVSIVMIFVIIAITLQSFSLPFILVCVIEFAIFINLGIPYYTHTPLVFIAPICISTIQLGSTVDYAILMTTRYKTKRYAGFNKHDAIEDALAFAIPSIVVSALGLFAATFGVAVYSEVDIIKSMCSLMARGALISLLSVMFMLPSLLMVFDHIIIKTSRGFINKNKAGGNQGQQKQSEQSHHDADDVPEPTKVLDATVDTQMINLNHQ